MDFSQIIKKSKRELPNMSVQVTARAKQICKIIAKLKQFSFCGVSASPRCP
jgi:hypothetical protein